VLGREVPFPSLADVGYLAAVPLAAAALLSLPFAAHNAAGRFRQVLDGLLIAASPLLISWVVVLNQVFRRVPTTACPRPSASPTRSATSSSAPSCCSWPPGPAAIPGPPTSPCPSSAPDWWPGRWPTAGSCT
jgi:hypothetical protein